VELTESELRTDDEMSFVNHQQAKEHLAIEQSAFASHALLIQKIVQKKHVKLDREKQQFLDSIRQVNFY
jgi:hypothetical protein